jgi:hypothetical protein
MRKFYPTTGSVHSFAEYGLTKREENAVTLGFAKLGRCDLKAPEQKIVKDFAEVWFLGKQLNFDDGRLGSELIRLCKEYKIAITYMAKAGKGPMVPTQFQDTLDRYQETITRVRDQALGYPNWGSWWKGTTMASRVEYRNEVLDKWLVESDFRRHHLFPWNDGPFERLEKQVRELEAKLTEKLNPPPPLHIDRIRQFRAGPADNDDDELLDEQSTFH